ncbi:MAG: hypothetical protein JNL22_00470 [Bacteroidales bacterium]|nr:hypothetical protein [Bacteroidales bacterium]
MRGNIRNYLLLILFLFVFIYKKAFSQDTIQISSLLHSKIIEFSQYEDSIVGEKELFIDKIIIVDFYRDDNDGVCYLKISSSPVYFECCLKGYLLLDGKMVAFYDWRSYCSISFLPLNLINYGDIKQFKSFEQQNNVPPHENYYIKYKIVDFETLEFIKSGKQ